MHEKSASRSEQFGAHYERMKQVRAQRRANIGFDVCVRGMYLFSALIDVLKNLSFVEVVSQEQI